MTAPTTLPDALTQIAELRGQVRDLLRLLGQDAQPSDLGVSESPASTTGAREFSEGLVPKQAGKDASQHLLDLHQMIETVPDIIFTLDLQGDLVRWNKRLQTVTGFTPQELAGRPALAFVPEHEHAQTAAAIRRAFEDGYAELEGHLLTKAQFTIPYHWTGAALKDEDGRVIGITGVGRDVSEKKRIQAEFQRQRQQLLSAQALAHVGSWEWEIASGDMEWSEEQFRIFGHAPGTIPAAYGTFVGALMPEDHHRVATAIETALQGMGTLEFECRIVRPNGEIRNIHCLGEISCCLGGHPIRVSGSTLDITDQRHVESDLRQSEAHFRALIENSSDIITVLDSDGTIRFESPSFERLLGYQQHEIDGRSAFDFIHPDDLPTVLEKFQQVVQRPGESQTAMFRFRHKDGSWLPLEGIGRSILGTDAQRRVIVNSRDITERRRTQEALTRSYDLLNSFVEHTPAAVAMLDKELRYVAVSRRWVQDYRLDEQNLIGKHHYDIFPEIRSNEAWQAVHRRCLGGAVERREEDRFVRTDGSEDWLQWEVRPWEDVTGDIGGIIMFTEVITERKRAEQALRLSEERYARATAIGKVGVWELDVVTGLYHADFNLKALFGYEPDELSTDPYVWLGLVHPEDQSIALKAWEGIVSGSTDDYYYELRMIRKDGTLIWTDVRGHAERDEHGHVQRLTGATVDVTERKQIQDRLVKKEHELRTMLDALPIGIWFTDQQGHVLYGNPAGQQIWSDAVKVGLPDQGVETRHWEHIEATDLPHRWTIGPVLTKDRPVLNEMIEIETGNGSRKIIRNCAVPVRNDAGTMLGAIVLNEDITERERIEQALRQHHALLSTIMDTATDLIFVKDLQGRYIHMNEAGARTLGMTVQDVIGWNDYALWPSDLAACCQTADRYVIETGKTVTVEESTVLNGTPTVFLTTKGPYRDTDGRTIGVIGISRDITERKQAEEALRQSEARLNEAQRLAHIGSWELDLTTHHLTWSDEIYLIFELDPDEFGFSYEAFLDLVHPEDRAAVDQAYIESVRMKTPYEITHRLLMPDGRVKHVQELGKTFYDATGAPVRSVGTVQDVTEATRLTQREAARLTQLQNLSELGLTLSGDPADIFERVVRMIGELFHVRVVCLSEIVGDDLRFKAVYSNGEVWRDAGHCPLAVTPCATVQRDKAVRLFDRVMELFPEATFLLDHQAVMYCGFPALDAQGQVVAVTCLLDDKSREFTAEEQALLRVFGQRIAVEIERARYFANQHRQAEALQRSHAFIRQVIDTTPNFVFAKDRPGRFTLANKAIATAYGTTVDNLIGKTDADFNRNPDEVNFSRLHDLEVIDTRRERFIPEERITDATGNVRWLQTVKRPLLNESGEAVMVLGAATDITERKRIEEALRQRERDLQQAIEDRQRISEDLHDGILQSIYAIGLGLEACKPLVADLPNKSAVKLNAALQRTIGQLNHVLEEVRNFIAGLESQILDGQDFEAVLRTMVHTLAAHYPIPYKVTFEQHAAQSLSTEQAYHVMNIAREALSNSLRHSGATRITVSLKRLHRSVRLSVTDNGVGFNPVGARDVGHGLANMAARTQKIGGKLTLQSKPRQGAKVLVDIPRRLTDADT